MCVCYSGGIGCDGEDRGQSRRCLSSVEIYNPDTDTWRMGPTLPMSLLSLRTNASNIGVVEGKLYLCGYYKGAGQFVNACQWFPNSLFSFSEKVPPNECKFLVKSLLLHVGPASALGNAS